MFTDIVGYSALTQRSEALALRLLEKHNELIRPVLSKHGGVEVKTIGDSFLVEFSSALDATECAIDVQRVLGEYNQSSSDKILVRIGIHVGDVVHKGSDVFGDAVNIASRIESLAQGGGICITDQVYAQVQNKMALEARKLEQRQLKNISIPVSVYEIREQGGKRKTETEQLDMQRLAVLPFANISPDPNDEYFADGMTEELISKLSLLKNLKVIARTSVMKYKGKEKSISEIGRELGAGILVEGSVRKAGNRIRVTVQVINANNEEHLWASNYDNSLDDIFAVQAEIADKVSSSLPASLASKQPIHVSQDTKNMTAYTYYLKAQQLFNEGNMDSIREALELFTNATKLDPNFARACVGIGNCYAYLGIRSGLSREEAASGMRLACRRALEIDPNLAEAHALASFLGWADDDFPLAQHEAKKALELNPNLAEVHFNLSRVQMTLGYPQSSLKALETAYSLDPLSGQVIRFLSLTLAWTGREAEALDLLNRSLKIAPFEARQSMAEYFLGKGDYAKAEEEVSILEKLSPFDFTTIAFRAYLSAAKNEKQELDKAVAMLERKFKTGATFERTIGYIKYLQGDMDGFFEEMFRAVEGHTLDPFRMRYSPTFAKAREDPRYRKLLERNGVDPDLKEPL